MSEQKIIQFNGEELTIHKTNYNTRPGLVKLQLYDEQGFPSLTATKNIDKTSIKDYVINKNSALIKNYSENQGILEALIKAGYIKNTDISVSSGYEKLNLVTVLI